MITAYLSLYLVLIVVVAAIVSWLAVKLNLPSPRLVAIFIVFFVLSPLIGGYFYMAYFNSLPETVVPEVVGLPVAAAKEKLESFQLKAREAGNVYEAKYPAGYVVSHRPEAGRTVKAGRVVNLMISSGDRKTKTPNLLGRPFFEADALLSAAGLQAGEVKKEHDPNAAEGTILAQEPLPEEETGAGQKVDLLISTTMEVKMQEPATEEGKSGGFKLW